MTSLTNDETSMGEVLRDGERVGLRFVRRFAHPVERVWSAITESDQLQFWMPCDIVGERRAGADITLPFWPAQVEKYQLKETALSRAASSCGIRQRCSNGPGVGTSSASS